jgi:hypothetical protein
MPYIAMNPQKFIGTSVGNGQCVAFARTAASIGHTSTWTRGELVRGATLAIGTAIATFDDKGKYENDIHGRSHAAIYLGQDTVGIMVLDQWVTRTEGGEARIQPVHRRPLAFSNKSKPVNDGRNYYVIE